MASVPLIQRDETASTKSSPLVEEHLVNQQARLRLGKSTSGQFLNLTQYIEDGFKKKGSPEQS